MKQFFNKLLVVFLLASVLIPQVTLAVWWNPFSWFSSKPSYEDLEWEVDDLEYRYNNCSSRLEEYQYALQEANDNIEEAQSYAWSGYYDMGYALDNLQTVDEPSY